MNLLSGILITLLLAACAVLAYLASRKREVTRQNQALQKSLDEAQVARQTLAESIEQDRSERDWYRILFASTSDMVFVFDIKPDGTPGSFLEVNDIACQRLKYSREEILELVPADLEAHDGTSSGFGYSTADLVTLSDEYVKARHQKFADRAARTMVERILAAGELTYESDFEDHAGKRFPVTVHARKLGATDQSVIILTARDVTEQKHAEERLSDSEQRFRKFFQDSPIGIAIYDNQRKLMDTNRACMKMLGVPDPDQFARFNIFDNPFLPPEIRQKLASGENVRFEMAVDFSEVLGRSLFITSRSDTGWFDILIHNMGNDKTFHPRGYFAQFQDVTDRHRTESELRKREKQLLQAEKMEAIGSMAGGIAHDFNNILTPIIGYAALVSRLAKGSDDLKQFAENIERAAHRAKDLVMQILTFSRKSDSDDDISQPICVIPIAKEVLNLQKQTLPPNIQIERVIKTEEDVVMANPTKIHQILMNLCTNAVHAMKQTGGTLELRITDYFLKDPARSDTPDLPAGHYLRISIKDTGSGIEKSILNRIFEPFFTTKPKGEGTGMGLAVVLGIVKGLKGAITVESEVGVGSVFHVILPLVEAAVRTAAETAVELATGSGTVMVVDDDPDILQMVSDMLKSLGYEPVTANQAFGALKIFQLQPDRFNAVIMDQVMPAMTGLQLAMEIRKLRQDIPLILCTAHHDVAPEDAKAAGIADVLSKPILLDDLAGKLHRLMPAKK